MADIDSARKRLKTQPWHNHPTGDYGSGVPDDIRYHDLNGFDDLNDFNHFVDDHQTDQDNHHHDDSLNHSAPFDIPSGRLPHLSLSPTFDFRHQLHTHPPLLSNEITSPSVSVASGNTQYLQSPDSYVVSDYASSTFAQVPPGSLPAYSQTVQPGVTPKQPVQHPSGFSAMDKFAPIYGEDNQLIPRNALLQVSAQAKLPTRYLNSFSDNQSGRLPANFKSSVKLPSTMNQVNSYIKAIFTSADANTRRNASQGLTLSQSDSTRRYRVPERINDQPTVALPERMNTKITRKPRTDKKIMDKESGEEAKEIPRRPSGSNEFRDMSAEEFDLARFYTGGFCGGRSLLRKTNGWLMDIFPMAAQTEVLVWNSIMSLAAMYMFEYTGKRNLIAYSNICYAKAVSELDNFLNDPKALSSSKRAVAAIALLNMHDVVTWEVRRDKTQVPRWLDGARLASSIMDRYNSGTKYGKTKNVQADSAERSMAVVTARAAIFALPLTPLDINHTERQFTWLIHGDEEMTLRIHGASGLSPQLLHMWSLATHYCGLFQLNPTSRVYPVATTNMLDGLKGFKQWSELGESHESFKKLLEDFDNRDKTQQMREAALLTAIGAYAWVFALKIYLLCRFFRLPRRHASVSQAMNDLADCVRRMPTQGQNFTAQIPLLPIFFLGLLSIEPSHRQLTEQWFVAVTSMPICRSSVVPLWPALKNIWGWIDEVACGAPDANPEISNCGERDPWWERMVFRILATEGTLCLI